MGAANIETLVSLEEYLHSSYSPDMEYVDGVLVEIHAGDPQHSTVQSNIIYALRRKYAFVKVLPELDDRMSRLIEKLKEYAEWGASNVWMFDPRTMRMYAFKETALLEIEGDLIATESPRLELTRDEIFQD